MENKIINIKTVAEIAKALKELRTKVVFVGGAVISLYTDDEAADEIRPTSDIDLTIQLLGYNEWNNMQERLHALGFSPDPNGKAICSYLYKDISVDIMPTEDSSMGKSNRWYKPGFNYLQEITLHEVSIKILSVPYFLATKFEAFNDRGKSNHRTSHDFEDIIYVIDNRINIVDEFNEADNTVKEFLREELSKILSHDYSEEIIQSQMHPFIVDERYPMLIEKIKNMCTE